MKAVILAAGQGKRLRPITETIPKAMARVCGKPMLEIILKQLHANGITEAVLVVHYKKEQIEQYFGNEYRGMKLHYAEQKEMKGTGDAVLTAAPYIDGEFLVIACDTIFPTQLIARIKENPSPCVLTVCEVSDARRFGVIETEGKKITGIVEKSEDPPTNLANFSVYKFPKHILELCATLEPSPRGEYEITDAIQMLIDEGIRCEFELVKDCLDIGTHEQLQQAQEIAKELFTGNELTCGDP